MELRVVARYLEAAAVARFDAEQIRRIQKDIETFLASAQQVSNEEDYERLRLAAIAWGNTLLGDLESLTGYLQGQATSEKQLETWYRKILTPLRRLDVVRLPGWELWTGEYSRHVRFKWVEEVQKALAGIPGLIVAVEGLRKRHKIHLTTPDLTERAMHIAGFETQLIGFDPDDPEHIEALSKLEQGLRAYTKRAKEVLPLLVTRRVPLILKFHVKSMFGAAGQLGEGRLDIYPLNITQATLFTYTVAHEMAHHLELNLLSHEASSFWARAIKGNWGDLDLRDVLKSWGGRPFHVWNRDLRENDPILYLQVDALTSGHSRTLPKELLDNWTEEGIQEYLAKGGNPMVRVPKVPITGYASANPHEAFAEAVALLVTYGPRAVDPQIVSWLHIMMPGELKVASKA